MLYLFSLQDLGLRDFLPLTNHPSPITHYPSPFYFTPINSTSKINVASGGITPPAPREPYPR
jgi:hypothetical protein